MIREWLKSVNKPKTTTLVHEVIYFRTLDGKDHEYSGMRFHDPGTLRCSGMEYYLIGRKYLKDDLGVIYPMNYIGAIWSKVNSKIDNVKVIEDAGIYQIWYSAEDIEVVE